MPPPERQGTTRDEITAENAIVAAGHRLEVEAAIGILQRGGNAVDAAVAGAFVAELAEPAMCGIGGHGVMSVYMADTRETTIVDFYDVAPAKATPDMYERLDKRNSDVLGYLQVKGDAQSVGYKSVMVPSQVAGLCAAHERFGTLPLTEIIAPAITAGEGRRASRQHDDELYYWLGGTHSSISRDGRRFSSKMAYPSGGNYLAASRRHSGARGLSPDFAQDCQRGPSRVLRGRNRKGHRHGYGRGMAAC